MYLVFSSYQLSVLFHLYPNLFHTLCIVLKYIQISFDLSIFQMCISLKIRAFFLHYNNIMHKNQ